MKHSTSEACEMIKKKRATRKSVKLSQEEINALRYAMSITESCGIGEVEDDPHYKEAFKEFELLIGHFEAIRRKLEKRIAK